MIENPGNSFLNELYSILLIGKIILLVLIAVFLLIVFIRFITVLYHKKIGSSHKKYLLAYSGNLLIVAFVFTVTDLVNLHSEILEAWPILITAIFLTIFMILLIIALITRILANNK